MKTTKALAVVALCGSAQLASAAADFRITELYTGLSGPDGTADWFEITNFGSTSGDTGLLWYDDESADPTVNDQLPSFILNPGDSAVFVLGLAGDVATWESIWGTGITVGAVDGAGLGQGGDSVFLFDGNTSGAGVVDSATYPEALSNQLFTIEIGPNGSQSLSIEGVNGAFASNAFPNEDFNPEDPFLVNLVGSPGTSVVPVPAAVWLFGSALGLLAGIRRKFAGRD
jgi:hypothetical protein